MRSGGSFLTDPLERRGARPPAFYGQLIPVLGVPSDRVPMLPPQAFSTRTR